MIKLDSPEVRLASTVNLDQNGRLFFWEGDLYRAISPSIAPIYQELLASDNVSRLFDLGLVETKIAPIQVVGYDLVLKHRQVQNVSFVTEWCGGMLKDAALLTLELSLALDQLGLELQDAHPWNILFDGCKPIFIDFSSIRPRRNSDAWHPIREFLGTFLNPLYLVSAGHAQQSRDLLVDPKKQVGRRIAKRDMMRVLLKGRQPLRLLESLVRSEPSLTMSRREAIKKLQIQVSELSIPLKRTSWSDYCHEEVDLSSKDAWIVKRQSVNEALSRSRPETLLDVGSNTGWFSKLAAMHGARVLAFDRDETSINKLYSNENARELGILPLVMDFRHPTPAYGIGLRCIPAIERYKCDMVLGLAIVHHLVFAQYLKFEEIIESLSAFTRRWLLVEFIPKDDKYVSEWYDESYSWYTEENFVMELKKRFRTVNKLPSNPAPRSLFFCEV